MAKIEADFSDIVEQTALPKGIYSAVIWEARSETSKTNNPMLVMTFQIEGEPYSGRKIPFVNVMLGGTTKEGKPMPLFTLANLLEATGISYTCAHCNATLAEPFYRGTGDDGLVRGGIYCPACKRNMRVKFDTDDFQGKPLRIAVDVEKILDSDRERNTVKKFLHAAS